MPTILSTTQGLTDPVSDVAISSLLDKVSSPLADGFDSPAKLTGRSASYLEDQFYAEQSDLLFAFSDSGASAASLETAIPINLAPTGQTLNDGINLNNPEKFYRFNLTNRSNIKFGLNSLNSDLNLYLLDANGNVVSINSVLQQSINTGNLAEVINTNLNPGVYYLKVAAGAANANTSFNLSFQTTTNSHPDLLWRNYATGENALWLMNGTNAGLASFPAAPDRNWHIQTTADLNSDGKTDIVWRNQVNGANLVWLMNGTSLTSMVGLLPIADLNWQIQGTGDFNSDGKTDIVWRNQVDGANLVWLMNGTTFIGQMNLPSVPDPNWQIQGTGDFNSDGKTDIVWRNQANGANLVWFRTYALSK